MLLKRDKIIFLFTILLFLLYLFIPAPVVLKSEKHKETNCMCFG